MAATDYRRHRKEDQNWNSSLGWWSWSQWNVEVSGVVCLGKTGCNCPVCKGRIKKPFFMPDCDCFACRLKGEGREGEVALSNRRCRADHGERSPSFDLLKMKMESEFWGFDNLR